MQPSDVCRICGGQGLLLQISDQGTDYTEDIEDCLAVKVKADDGQPQEICHYCLGTLCLCKPYVTRINLLKDNNAAASSKKCYTCQSTKGHLFPFPDTSIDKLQEFFGLSVVKSKNSKICHECQYYLDCVSDLRGKANTAKKLSRSGHGQDIKFMVNQKNASVDDLVCSLKDREVEVDESPLPRKTSRSGKSSQVKSRGNGSTINNVYEGLSSKRKSGSKSTTSATAEDNASDVEVNTRKKSNRQPVKENNFSDNDSSAKSAKGSGSKRRRRLSRSSDSDLNTSLESLPESKSKKLSESRRSSRDSNDSKPSEPSKKSIKSKDSKEKAEPKPSPRSKRQKLSKHDKHSEEESDSGSDSMCLASLANCDVKEQQLDESAKRSGRNKSSMKTPEVTSQKKSQGGPGKNAEAVKQKQLSRYSKNESEGSKSAKRVHFGPELTKENKRRKQAEQSRKKIAEVSEESSEDEGARVVEASRRKKPSLNAYTCTVCSDDFRSTVEGKEHELRHDERFNNFEIKLQRVLNSEIAGGLKKSPLIGNSKNEDEEDDLWNILPARNQTKSDHDGEGVAFDALFDSEANNKSFATKGSDSLNLADKNDHTSFNNSLHSELEGSNEDTSKSEKPNDSAETLKPDDSKQSEVDKQEEILGSEGDKSLEKEESSEAEGKNAVVNEETLESEKKEEKSDADDTGSLNSTAAAPKNGGSVEGDKPVEANGMAMDELVVPEDGKSELNGTVDDAEGIDSPDKKEVNIDSQDKKEVTIDSEDKKEVNRDKTEVNSDSQDKTGVNIDSEDKTEVNIDSEDKTEVNIDSQDKKEVNSDSQDKKEENIDSQDKKEENIDSQDKKEADATTDDKSSVEKSGPSQSDVESESLKETISEETGKAEVAL